MIRKMIGNDIKQNKLLAGATVFFMGISAMLFALTSLLFFHLTGAIEGLMDKAKVPDYMQMHTQDSVAMGHGSVAKEHDNVAKERIISEVRFFSDNHEEVEEWQICGFLNLDNSRVVLGGRSLADSTQDNGCSVQGERFDYLLDLESKIPEILPGEVYVPVCYRALYDLAVGDIMEIGSRKLTIAGFIRDAQMNSMMASSKRFLVNEEDYGKIKNSDSAQEEYLIEFLVRKGTDINAFSTAYAAEGLPANGPAVTRPLVRMINALSDGTMIFVLFLVSVVTLLVSLLCIRFILSLQMERDRKEVGMLKALGVEKAEIRRIYFMKYLLFSVCGGIAGLLAAFALKTPLAGQMKELYGVSEKGWQTAGLSLATVIFTEGIILLSILRSLKKMDGLTVLEALFSAQKKKNGRGRYGIIGLVSASCAFLILVPQNLYSTMAAPGFAAYMGIGDGEIRMDIRQTEDIVATTERIASALAQDEKVEKYAILCTRSCTAILPDGKIINFTVETGDHSVFPVSCSEGKLPGNKREIALSAMYAEELGLSVGDSLRLAAGGQAMEYRVCGIYSDITNGGKTAKACFADDRASVVWSVLYVSLKNPEGKEEWMERYGQMGADVIDIADYVEDTYGQTLGQLRLASRAAMILAMLVAAVVVMLFMRLIVEKNRYTISLHKALGFTSKDIKQIYFAKGLLPVIAGTAAGLLVGNLLGERLCGMILRSFGADGFRFAISWEYILARIPAAILGAAVPALLAGIAEIKEIKAYECCNSRE